MRNHRAWIPLVVALAMAVPARAQSPAPPGPAPLRVFLTCDTCDVAALKADVAFVTFVADRAQAMVEVVITVGTPENGDQVWALTFTGRGPFAGQDRQLPLRLPASAPAADVRAGLARTVKFGLAEYAVHSDVGSQLDVSVRPDAPAGGARAAGRAKDPWNFWVFRLSAGGYQYGEVSSSSSEYNASASASRTTDAWKIRFSGYKSASTSRYDFGETLTIRTKQHDWSVDSLIVKSLNGHWSAGLTASASSSSYSNQKRAVRLSPAIEYDVFPYAESNQRSLTLQYAVGPARYEYREITIFDRLKETRWQQSLSASLGLRQPWGSAGASADFSQNLAASDQYRISVYGNVSVRLLKGLSVSGSTGYSRIRDQFYLEKAGATEEEILLRLRQLATGYSYSARVSLSYSFGSLSNATVNPRFGG